MTFIEALSIIVGVPCLAAAVWLCWQVCMLPKAPYPEDRAESERAALEFAQSIRDYLLPDGEKPSHAVPTFGELETHPVEARKS